MFRYVHGWISKLGYYQFVFFQEDVWLMKDIGFDAYHLSISWTRVLPGTTLYT